MTARGRGTSWEDLAWAVVLLSAALLRLPGLGDAPLSQHEAGSAVLAWQLAAGEAAPAPSDPSWSRMSPLQTTAELAVFALLGGGSETAARVPSALAGIGLVLVPILLRGRLGGVTALVLAALLALDPVAVATSRRADGVAIAVLVAAAALAVPWRSRAAAALMGLLTVAGSAAWTLLPILGLASLLDLGRRDAAPAAARAWVASALAVLGGSGLLAALVLLGGASASLTSWMQAWSMADPSSPPLRLGATLPLALGLGLLGLLGLARSGRLAAALVVGASLAWAAALAARPGGDPAAALLAVVALTAAAAPAIVLTQDRWTDRAGRPWRADAAIAALVLALAVPGIVRTGRIASGRVAPGPAPQVAGLRLLGEDVERLSSQRAIDPYELPVEVLCQPFPDPLLRWTLREARHVRFHSGGLDPRDTGPALAIGPDPASADEVRCDTPRGRLGARYADGTAAVVLWVPRER